MKKPELKDEMTDFKINSSITKPENVWRPPTPKKAEIPVTKGKNIMGALRKRFALKLGVCVESDDEDKKEKREEKKSPPRQPSPK